MLILVTVKRLVDVKHVFFFLFRLWHQLTLKLSAFIKTPAFAKGDSLVRVSVFIVGGRVGENI